MKPLAVVAGLVNLLVVCLALQTGRQLSAEEDNAYTEVKEAVVGTDSVNDVLDSLPSKGGLLRLVYDNMGAPTVMETLEVKNKEVTIRGQGQQGPALTCNGTQPVMRIKGGDVSVTDVMVSGCENVAVELVSPGKSKPGGNLKMQRCMFSDNFHSIKKSEGIDRVDESVNITESEFIYSSASAVELHGLGSVSISYSKFRNNTSGSFGGSVALYTIKNMEVVSSTFANCSAVSGGAIWASDGGDVESVSSSATIRNSTMEDNFAVYHGGAMYVGFRGAIAIEDSTFLGNLAAGSGNSSGGAIRVDSYNGSTIDVELAEKPAPSWSLSIVNSVFKKNSADRRGGGIYAYSHDNGTISVSDCDFNNNTADLGAGFYGRSSSSPKNRTEVLSDVPDVQIDVLRSTFHNNMAFTNAGGIFFVNMTSGNIESCHFENGTAADGAGGGVSLLYWDALGEWKLRVAKSKFAKNVAASRGGGMFVLGLTNGLVEIEDTDFIDNAVQTLSSAGGGFSGETHSNSVDDEGAEIFPHVVMNILRSNFAGNTAVGKGGGVSIQNVTMTAIDSCVFESCSAGLGGGGLSVFHVFEHSKWSLDVLNSVFRNNSGSTGWGGGALVYSTSSGSIDFQGTNWTRNTAKVGGALHAQSQKETINGTVHYPEVAMFVGNGFFSENNALLFGGCIDATNVIAGTFESCTFESCTSDGNSGALAFDNHYLPLTWSLRVMNSVFRGNSAAKSGGGIGANGFGSGRVVVHSTEFQNNSAVSKGGGLAIEALLNSGNDTEFYPNVTCDLWNSNFSDNSAVSFGGGTFLWNLTAAKVDSCVFERDSARFGGGLSWFHTRSGVPWVYTITDSVFRDNRGLNSGGGVVNYLYGGGTAVIQGSTFTNNTGIVGGGIHTVVLDGDNDRNVSDASIPFPVVTVKISGSKFFDNHAEIFGGGVNLWNVSSATVDSCEFEHGSAGFGGGLSWFNTADDEPWQLTVENSFFINHTADVAGGGVYSTSSLDGTMSIRWSDFDNNTATTGGGIAVSANAVDLPDGSRYPPKVTFESVSSIFTNNVALEHGGGINLQDVRSANISSNLFKNGSASLLAGGLYWTSNYEHGFMLLNDCSFFNNEAGTHGGGVAVVGTGQSKVQQCVFEENQCVGDAGALYYYNVEMDGKYPDIVNSTFARNEAHVGGALVGFNVRGMNIEKASFRDNKAAVGGAASFSPGSAGDFRLAVVESEFIDNTAGKAVIPGYYSDFIPFSGGGGAISILAFYRKRSAVRTEWLVRFNSTVFNNNTARNGGAILATSPELSGDSWLRLEGSTFEENLAAESGNAIIVDEPDKVAVTCSPTEPEKSLAEVAPEYCDSWKDVGPIPDSRAGLVAALSLGAIELNFSRVRDTESRPHLPPISATIYDALNRSRSFGGIGQVEVIAECDADEVLLFGELSQVAVNGTVTFTGLRAWGPPGNYTITFKATNTVGTYKSEAVQSNATLELRGCLVGERGYMEGGEFLVCEHCNPRFFSFDPDSFRCEACKEHAECGASEDHHVHPLVPQDGYWHSSPFSTQIHKCLARESCMYEGRMVQLQTFTADTLPQEPRTYSQDEYQLCREGSEGPLCGSCGDGYGHTKNGWCKKCDAKSSHGFGIFLSTIWMAIMMSIAAFFSIVQRSTSSEGFDLYEDNETRGIELSSRPSDVHGENGSEGQGNHGSSGIGDLHGKRSEQLFKIAINFFQVNSTALLMTSGWRSFLRTWLEIQDVAALASISTTSDWIVPECSFHMRKYKSIIVAHLDAGLPFVIAAFLVAVWAGVRKRRNGLRGELLVIMWSAAFYCYVALTKAFMGMFNCIKVDNEVSSDPLGAYSTSNGLFWVPDTQFHCFKGHGRLYSVFIGSVGICVFLLGVPLYLCIFIYKNRAMLANDDFRNKYGFLYGAYNKGFSCWEVAVMLRKLMLATFAVFGASLGSELHGGLMLGVIVVATLAQLYVRPFRDGRLNVMEALSLLITSFTFYVEIVMNDGSQHWKTAISAIAFILNLVFCGALLVHLVLSMFSERILKKAIKIARAK